MKPIKYHPIARLVHWVMALLIIAALGIALSIDDMPLSPDKIKLISWHKALGITVLCLLAFRLITKLLVDAPAPVKQSPIKMKLTSFVHIVFYILMFAVPLNGWLYSNSSGYGVSYFGLFELPMLIEANEALSHQLKEIHETIGILLLVLVVLHILAVIYHSFKKDGTLKRMV